MAKMTKEEIVKIIKDLKGDFGSSNEKQAGGLQLLKGLVFSDEPLANDFMKELDKAMTIIANKLTSDKKKESIVAKESFRIPGTDIIVEAGQSFEISTEEIKEGYSDNDYLDTIDRLVDILRDSNNHSAADLVFSIMHDRQPDKTKKLFDTWYKREVQGYL